jgi:hypothetical protein
VPHADACLELKAHPHLRLYARQQGARYEGDPRVVGASVDHIDGGLHGPGAEPIQGFLAGVRPAIIF